MATYRHRMVEAVLRDFPDIHGDYQKYKHFLDVTAAAGGMLLSERVDGGRRLSPADKYLDRYDDGRFRLLECLVTTIYEAYKSLDERQRRIVALMYWGRYDVETISNELKFSVRRVYQIRNEALNLLYRPFLEVQDKVEGWRAGRLE